MSRLKTEIILYWKSLVRLVYPAACTLCHAALSIRESHVCRPCRKQIALLKAPYCKHCARSLPAYEKGVKKTVCSACRNAKPAYDRGFSFFAYEDKLKKLLHELKYAKKPHLLQVFEPTLAKLLPEKTFDAYDFIVPVPLDLKHSLKREFNQAFLIAALLQKIYFQKTPVRNLLKKRKMTKPQSLLARRERLENLKGAFSLKRKMSLTQKKILLVDDVFTTGSTIGECAAVLKANGASRVDFLTLARGISQL